MRNIRVIISSIAVIAVIVTVVWVYSLVRPWFGPTKKDLKDYIETREKLDEERPSTDADDAIKYLRGR